ncbi:ABC transporter permease [Sinorhizobium sp. NFACC03]|uniref:ABC transporter permease n=1 Tax=Sinorhizobium sp. NFACC03 TaxID=1566295 RepID=UPI0008917A51|nr:ABC transporter permease [Sinorhizobium sp. NFACC03]SDA87567.1 mannopine transport system permease protein [Sinorhizobium sp. NFACC03]
MSIDRASVPRRLPTMLDRIPFSVVRKYSRAGGVLVAGVAIGSILFFLLLPTLIVIPMSLSETNHIEFPPRGLTLKWYSAYFNDPDWMAATWFSFRIALATTAAATITGTMAALAIARGCLPFKSALQALALGPMIVPHIVLGVALYLAFSPLQLTGSFLGFLIAHTVLAIPYVIIPVTASLQRFDPTLELAALNCGANRLRAFFFVVLPNIASGVAAAAVFAFLASFDEATVAFFISDIGGKPIGRKMFEDIDFNLTPVIAAVSTVLVATSLLLMGTVHLVSARSSRS